MFEDQDTTSPQALDPRQEAALIAHKRYREGIALASGLLVRDKFLLCIAYIILVAPSIISSALPTMNTPTMLLFAGLERFIYANFFYLILHRWFKEFSLPTRTFGLRPYLIILGIHAFFWGVSIFPLIARPAQLGELAEVAVVILSVPLVVLSLRYFFYFIPLMLGNAPIAQVFTQADTFTSYHRSLAIKLCIPPLVASALYSGLITSFSPDIRHAPVAFLLDLGGGIFWVLFCYLSLGVGFSILAKSRSLTSELDPYLDARLDTIRIHSPAWLTGLMHPAHAGKFILLVALIWIGNMVRMWELPPAPTIHIENVAFDGAGTVTVALTLRDDKYSFRGFRPVLFRLAGETGEPLSLSPHAAATTTGESDTLYYYPRSWTESKVSLTFALMNRQDDFDKLQDVHLWYANSKIAHIKSDQIQKITAATEAVQ